ncbi:MAG: hypothetical protein K6E75_01935 [Lachnospiraceae bacterium]|nr:hypothetical protein [Lachnospiraceae bacterium]
MKKTIWNEENIRKEIKKLDAKTGLSGARLPIFIRDRLAKGVLGLYCPGGIKGGIRKEESFSFSSLWLNNPDFPEEEAVNVIRHEYAHYMDYNIYGRHKPYEPQHGEKWIICCDEIGAFPVAKHNLTRDVYFHQKHETEERVTEQLSFYRAGDRIRHPKFGTGVIREISGEGTGRNAKIEFPQHGFKTLGLRWISENCIRIEAPEYGVITDNRGEYKDTASGVIEDPAA